jgi:hypothetical protein
VLQSQGKFSGQGLIQSTKPLGRLIFFAAEAFQRPIIMSIPPHVPSGARQRHITLNASHLFPANRDPALCPSLAEKFWDGLPALAWPWVRRLPGCIA